MTRMAVVNPSLAPSMNASYTFTFFTMPAMMKERMMPKRMMLATSVLTVSIVSFSICEKPQMVAATNRHMPPSTPKRTGCRRLMRW